MEELEMGNLGIANSWGFVKFCLFPSWFVWNGRILALTFYVGNVNSCISCIFGLGGIVLDAFKKKRKEKKECVIELIVGN